MKENETMSQSTKKSFCEWFDPHNKDHIRAYAHLQKTGTWPEGFKPERIYMETGWQGILAFKLANTWIEYKLSIQKEGKL
jgi:hypothetical protein